MSVLKLITAVINGHLTVNMCQCYKNLKTLIDGMCIKLTIN